MDNWASKLKHGVNGGLLNQGQRVCQEKKQHLTGRCLRKGEADWGWRRSVRGCCLSRGPSCVYDLLYCSMVHNLRILTHNSSSLKIGLSWQDIWDIIVRDRAERWSLLHGGLTRSKSEWNHDANQIDWDISYMFYGHGFLFSYHRY